VGTYRQVVRTVSDEPITNQTIGLLSFILFEEPKKTKRGKNIFGFVKLRGNYADEHAARRNASNIVKEQDSKYRIRLGPVGTWLPITEDDDFVKDQLDVRLNDDEIQLRDEAAHEEEIKRQRKIRELREKEDQVKDERNDLYADREGLEYYTMKRVTEKELHNNVDIIRNKLEDIISKLNTVRQEVCDLDAKHPDYDGQWVERYNVERRKSGIPDFIPNERVLSDFEQWKEQHKNTQ
jgi:hypothetical protein